MRRLVVALVAVSFVLMLSGCGGGGEEPEEVETTSNTGTVAAPASVEATSLPDRSAPESSTVFEPFPSGSSVPTSVAQRVESGQPTLILFVNGAQRVTNEVRSAVDEAIKENAGIVDLVVFDLGRYTGSDQYGQAVADVNELHADQNASKAVLLARDLKIAALPYIVMIDDQGFLVFRHRGLVDAEYLLMHMERLTD